MKLENRRILVTGGAGFIGSHLVDQLIAKKNEVLVIDDFSSGTPANLAHQANSGRLQIMSADIRDERTIAPYFHEIEVVFHLACRNVRLSLRQPTVVHEVNTTGTLNVLKVAVEGSVKRFLYVSSSEVNGTAELVPMPEEYHYRPETIYGASKLAGEYYTQVFQRSGWLETVIARPHNTYGPREYYEGIKGEVIPRFILRALAGLPLHIYGDGQQTRDFTYVTETADFLIRLVENDACTGQIFNICRGEEISVRHLADIILELTGSGCSLEFLPGRPGDVLRLYGDLTRIRRTLNTSPQISIRQGLALTIDWFKQNVPLTAQVLESIQSKNWELGEAESWLKSIGNLVNPGKAMKNKIPLALPWLDEAEVYSVRQTILSGWVTQGPKVNALEESFADYVGSIYACAVSSCTAALHLALLSVGLRPGDVVITVSYSFIASANAIRHCLAEPYFLDIDPNTGNIAPAILQRALEEDFEPSQDGLWLKDAQRLAKSESPHTFLRPPLGRLGAILIVHQGGMPAELDKILNISKKFGIPLVEDAACAIGSEIITDSSWEKIGQPHGDIACFSFHPRKVITTGDGGMLTTNNPEYDKKFRLLRQHGMNVPDLVRHNSEDIIFESYLLTGYNYRMTDIQAAVGIEQLRKLPEIVLRRRELASCYISLLQDIPGVRLWREPCNIKSNWQSFIVFIDDPGHQKSVMQALSKQGISTRRGIMCAHLEPPYASIWPSGCLPESEKARDTGIALPLYFHMKEQDCKIVIKGLLKSLGL